VLLYLLLIKVVFEPLIGKKIESAFKESNKDYRVEIGKVHFSILNSGLELENIILCSTPEVKGIQDLKGEIASIKLEGINLVKAIFKKDIDIREVTVFSSSIKGGMPFPEKAKPPKISVLNIRIDSLFFDKTNLDIRNTLTAASYSVKDVVLKVYDLQVEKLDTLSLGIVKRIDFDAAELLTISADSMYAYTATGINYSATSKTLKVDSFSIQPNYADYEFTARHQFGIDRIEAGFSLIHVQDFSFADYLKSGNLVCSYVRVGQMDMNIFRDNRKESKHVNKPAFQDMIYSYPGEINIDSIGVLSGNIIYTEHAEKANEPGWVSFNEINARIYHISNDTIYKTKEAYLKLDAEALLMGKGKLAVNLKGRIFDNQNTFSVNGTLSGLEINELNPVLEKNAFVLVKSGRIDAMNFSLTANNTKAAGKMILLYHGLNIAVKNKKTDDTTAIKERLESLIANMEILDSNPIPGKSVRVGIIDYKRDPEKFLLNYCFKSILTGIKTSIANNSKKKDK